MIPSPAPISDSNARQSQLRHWLGKSFEGTIESFEPASSDASFRRYFRVTGGGRTRIAMDAPPPQENCRPFVEIAALLTNAGVHVPEVLAQDLDRGFLLLTDLGNTTYLEALTRLRDNDETTPDASGQIDALYRDALHALVTLQRAKNVDILPEYDRALLLRELQLFPDWYLARQIEFRLNAKEAQVLDASFEALLRNNLAQPRVLVHRDYHSRNLMVCEPNPGILDFQDAVYGPITYDLVSLLRDAYIEWEESQVIDWCVRYWEEARRASLPVAADFGEFYRDFEWMGVQRQLKVIGIFARLAYRDGKRAYLDDQPRVMRYLKNTARRYGELQGLARLLDKWAPEVGIPQS